MTALSSKMKTKMPSIGGLHHYAYKCRDAEETRHFYEDILGMPMAHVMEVRDLVATTGELVSFLHIFFEMADGSCLAFFDLGDGKAAAKDPLSPSFSVHMALNIVNEAGLQGAMARLAEAGIPVQGPLDQEGFCRSIYFTDPNDIRLELTYTIADEPGPDHDAKGRETLARWAKEHRARVPA